MDFKQLVFDRYSCREFLDKEVPEQMLMELFELCRFAPSAANYQPWEFLVLNDKAGLNKAFGSYNNHWIKTAPVLIIAIGDVNAAWVRNDGKNHVDIDLAIFISHFTLAATEKGLATCWVCNFDVAKIIRDFSIPVNKIPVALIPLGFPLNKTKPNKKRKQINDFVFFKSFAND